MLDTVAVCIEPMKVGILSAISLSSGHNQSFLETILYRSAATNSLLAAQSFADQPVVIIYSGTVGLQHVLRDGRRSISTIFLPGDLLDFRHMKLNDATLVCLSPVKLCLFESDEFERMNKDNPLIQAALTDCHFRHCGFTASHCVDLSRKSAIEKLASFIFECRNRQSSDKGNKIALLLKRIDIADYMGLRPETLSRAFAKLKQRKLIAIDGIDYIRILNEPVLRQIANDAAIEPGCVT